MRFDCTITEGLEKELGILSKLVDMHMHVGFADDPMALASELAHDDISAFSNTVTPQEYCTLAPQLRDASDLRLGVGLHPWWIQAKDDVGLRDGLAAFDEALETTSFIGEAGLDFYPSRAQSKDEQISAFRHIARSCAHRGGCLMSMHSVKAERELLDILEDAGCTSGCTCILHSYGGPSDQLKRAIDLGCYFSIGQRMLATKRGREYARIIPEKQLLLESDLPEEGTEGSAAQIDRALADAHTQLACIRQVESEALGNQILKTSSALLGLRHS